MTGTERTATVDLPKPNDPRTYDYGEYCTAAWFPPEDEVEWYDVSVYTDDITIRVDDSLDSEEARILAGVLLAAADAAEVKS